MNTNPLCIPTVLIGVALFVATLRVYPRLSRRWVVAAFIVIAVIVAVPGLLYDAYYLHLFDSAMWFYQLRSIPGTEILAAGVGVLAGVAASIVAHKQWKISTVFCGALLVVVLMMPYIKPILLPLDLSSLSNRWSRSVCLQTSMSTCGTACAATLLRLAGKSSSEREMARECYSSGSGTENWYIARALRSHGLTVDYIAAHAPITSLPYPAIAGLGTGRSGHFVAVLGKTSAGYVIGNPIGGPAIVRESELREYGFSGFFMVVRTANRLPDGPFKPRS